MCWFITLGVPVRHRAAVEARSARALDLRLARATDSSAPGRFAHGDVLFTVTQGGCSCGLYPGPAALTEEEEDARARARYHRRGWSEARIGRVLAERRRASHGGPEAAHRQAWVALVADLVGLIGPVRLLAQDASSPRDGPSRAPQALPVSAFVRAQGAFPADTLLTLVPDLA